MKTFDKLKDKHLGVIGTPNRDKYELKLKKDVATKCKVCGDEFNELDMNLQDSRPKDICVACFTSNA